MSGQSQKTVTTLCCPALGFQTRPRASLPLVRLGFSRSHRSGSSHPEPGPPPPNSSSLLRFRPRPPVALRPELLAPPLASS